MPAAGQPPCRRCLLSETDPEGLYRQIRTRIELLTDEERTAPEEYAQRLAHCARCDALRSGLCSICGCFAELRAARREQHCPHEQHFW